eukprot:m.215512 g.215512  ORF g.215512 m.215512 type:complete len:261 (+) comp41658_c0_seq1:84-866(+)
MMAATSSPTSTKGLITLDQHVSTENIFISISGMIGAGKTTLATELARVMDLPVYYEPTDKDNVYLSDFYRDQARYSFPLQVFLLNRRFQQHQQIIWSGKGGVQDRTIYEDTVFAKVLHESGNMEDREYLTYRSLFSNMSNFMKKPNLIVHLDVSPEESQRRINMRSRKCEDGIPLAYLQNLHRAYEDFIQEISRIIPVIRVNYSEFQSATDMAEMVAQEYAKMCSIRQVTFQEEEVIGKFCPDMKKSKQGARYEAQTVGM